MGEGGGAIDGVDTRAGMNKIVACILSLIGFAIAFILVRYWISGDSYDIFGDSFERTLQRDAIEINLTLPRIMGNGIRLDKVTTGPGNTIIYNYTLITDEIGITSADKLTEFKSTIHDEVCSKLLDLRRNGTLVIYRYKTAQGTDIAEIQIPTRDCGK
jgi:hypothetical protein